MMRPLDNSVQIPTLDIAQFPAGSKPACGFLKQEAILKHSTHLSDLILYGAASQSGVELAEFRRIIISLVDQIKTGMFNDVNEKIDGSPSIVLGFNQENLPFVAYKGSINGAKRNLIFSSEEDVRRHYSPDCQLGKIFTDCVRVILPRLRKLSGQFKDYLFQCDLLFSESNQAKREDRNAVLIRANKGGIEYRISKERAEYEQIKGAKLGLAVHTVSKRQFNSRNGQLEAITSDALDSKIVKSMAAAIASRDIFAVDPWRHQVAVSNSASFSVEVEAETGMRLGEIERNLQRLTPEFQEAWQKALRYLQVFFNGDLYPPNQGGIYRLAFDGGRFDFDKFSVELTSWLSAREKGRDPKSGRALCPQSENIRLHRIAPLFEQYQKEFKAVLESYLAAIKLQYLLKPYMAELYRSKLGGGPAEGIMFGQVKLVDRLEFTTRNFSVNRRVQSFSEKSRLPKPLDLWQPGAAFFIAKLQPPHAGHIAAIRQAADKLNGRPLYVIASDKAPNLKADHWRKLGAAATRGELLSESYTHPFSIRLRKRILNGGIGGESKVYFINPAAFWEYLRRASEMDLPGKITLVTGTKEVLAQRYSSQLESYAKRLEILPIKMQAAGISATSVRRAIAKLSKGNNTQAEHLLDKSLKFIADKDERTKIKQALIREWEAVSRRADFLL